MTEYVSVFPDGNITQLHAAPAIKAARSPAGVNWYADLAKTKSGTPHPNLANVMTALRADPDVQKMLALDEMAGSVLLMHPVPAWGSRPGTAGEPRPLTDNDVTALQEWIQLAGIINVSRDVMHQAVDLRAYECRFHPVRDYLDGLVWDGTPRAETWLATYLGTQPSEYASAIGRMFLIGMAARIYKPGCKLDNMLIFEGAQGARKSTACAILGGEWFSDNLPDVTHGKDTAQHLAGKWLIEVAEMSATSKAEAEALKAFISRPTERYRPSYGRREIVQPRQCVFIGTTNRDTYLRDETGGRRFWPVKVGRVDTEALTRDRDQLLAEAVHLYRHGVAWWPDDALERELIKPEQEARFDSDIWEEIVTVYVEGRDRVTITDVATALEIPTGKAGRADQNRIAAILSRLNFQRGKKDAAGRRSWERSR
jgi:predicted P-loop ATPase